MNKWKSGIMGVVIGDALGCPVQFESREEVSKHPVTGMRGFGTFNLPAGSWTDDSSLTLALLESIRRTGTIDYKDIMDNFVKWLDDGAFTPYGYAYDIGRECGEHFLCRCEEGYVVGFACFTGAGDVSVTYADQFSLSASLICTGMTVSDVTHADYTDSLHFIISKIYLCLDNRCVR
jgi:hypothetical protein